MSLKRLRVSREPLNIVIMLAFISLIDTFLSLTGVLISAGRTLSLSSLSNISFDILNNRLCLFQYIRCI